jgi:hypothetical protein
MDLKITCEADGKPQWWIRADFTVVADRLEDALAYVAESVKRHTEQVPLTDGCFGMIGSAKATEVPNG